MKAKYKYETLHKDTGVTKIYQVDNYTVSKNGNEIHIIGVKGKFVIDDLDRLKAEINDAIERCGK